jgi:hypothetical protein
LTGARSNLIHAAGEEMVGPFGAQIFPRDASIITITNSMAAIAPHPASAGYIRRGSALAVLAGSNGWGGLAAPWSSSGWLDDAIVQDAHAAMSQPSPLCLRRRQVRTPPFRLARDAGVPGEHRWYALRDRPGAVRRLASEASPPQTIFFRRPLFSWHLEMWQISSVNSTTRDSHSLRGATSCLQTQERGVNSR